MKKTALIPGLIVATALAAGCAATTKATAPTAPAENAAAANEQSATVLAGKVVETMTVGNYSYIRVEKDGKSGWAAIPARKVAVGDEVELQPGTEMGQFTSPSLKRTFKNIYFSSGLKGAAAAPAAGEAKADAAAMPPGHPKIDGQAAAKTEQAPAANLLTGKVIETKEAGGYTYILFEKDGKKTWAAVPAADVKVGQEVKLLPGSVMPNFTSKSLNQTFDEIIFSGGLAQ